MTSPTSPTAPSTNVVRLHAAAPSDVLQVTTSLRKLLVAEETASYSLNSSFEAAYGAEIEDAVVKARRAVEAAKLRTAALLELLEATEAYETACTEKGIYD